MVTAEKRYWYLLCGLAQNSPRTQTDTEIAHDIQAKISTSRSAKRLAKVKRPIRRGNRGSATWGRRRRR
ncbi:MAG: hypothetical protein ABGY13_00685, partial [Verrucomicrobiia bacterium]